MTSPYKLIFEISVSAILGMLIYLALHLVPYNWFVDIDYVYSGSACVGSSSQLVASERDISWPMRGHVYAQIVKIDGVKIIETTIQRDNNFGYEESGYSEFYVNWSEPFTETGRYGVNSWLEIYPLPFITVKDFTSWQNNQFTVVNCN